MADIFNIFKLKIVNTKLITHGTIIPKSTKAHAFRYQRTALQSKATHDLGVILYGIDSRLIITIDTNFASIRRSKPLNQIITRIHTLILLLRLRCVRARNGLNLAAEVGVAKVSIFPSHQYSCRINFWGGEIV